MLEYGKLDRGVVEMVDTESLVPAGHLLRKIDAAVDFNRIYEMVAPLYSEDNGRPSVDPVVLFKMVLLQHLYGLPSLRRTAEEVSLNVAYRWFLGYTLQEETPHFSTVSCNFRHRFTAETVDQVFAWILEEAAQAGYLSPRAVFIDGTHQSQRQHEETDKGRDTGGIEALCPGADGGTRIGKPTERNLSMTMTSRQCRQRSERTTPHEKSWLAGRKTRRVWLQKA